MTNQEILTKAIEKAVTNGFEWSKADWAILTQAYDIGGIKWQGWSVSANAIIFSHDFAKAFWGEEMGVCDQCGSGNIKDCACFDAGVQAAWQYHLQQMVLEEDPIKYLNKFL